MAHRRMLALVLWGGALLASGPAAAQDSAPVDDVRTGFAGFAWGTGADAITAARGQPVVDTLARDYRRLVYGDTVDGAPLEITYLLEPGGGLLAGHLGFDKPAEKCQDAFKAIRKRVEAANPGLDKRKEQKVELREACSRQMGRLIGAWQVWWGDSGSARISQTMMSGATQVLVHYRGPRADAYVAEQLEQRGPSMEGFASFAWGTSRDSIVGRLGAPKLADSTSSTLSLSYVDMVLGERAVVQFILSEAEGLLKGTYYLAVPAGQDCALFYRKFHFALIERFPHIKPELIKRHASRKSFCESVADGRGSILALWKDPKSDAYVTVDLDKPGKFVRITYVGPTYRVWAKRTRQADMEQKL